MLLLLPPARFDALMTLRPPTCHGAGHPGYATHSDSQSQSPTRQLRHLDFPRTNGFGTGNDDNRATSALAWQDRENAGDEDGERLHEVAEELLGGLSVTSPSSVISRE